MIKKYTIDDILKFYGERWYTKSNDKKLGILINWTLFQEQGIKLRIKIKDNKDNKHNKENYSLSDTQRDLSRLKNREQKIAKYLYAVVLYAKSIRARFTYGHIFNVLMLRSDFVSCSFLTWLLLYDLYPLTRIFTRRIFGSSNLRESTKGILVKGGRRGDYRYGYHFSIQVNGYDSSKSFIKALRSKHGHLVTLPLCVLLVANGEDINDVGNYKYFTKINGIINVIKSKFYLLLTLRLLPCDLVLLCASYQDWGFELVECFYNEIRYQELSALLS